VHHQAIKDLAPGFVVEARSPDGLIEAVRRPGDSYVAAVQWHPEFHRTDLGTLDDRAILHDFLERRPCRDDTMTAH
jgi:putative glutamine amidotransferase